MPKLTPENLYNILKDKLIDNGMKLGASQNDLILFFTKNELIYQGGDIENMITSLELINARRMMKEKLIYCREKRGVISMDDIEKSYLRCFQYRKVSESDSLSGSSSMYI